MLDFFFFLDGGGVKKEVLLISLTIFSLLQSTGSQTGVGRTMVHCAGTDVLHPVASMNEDLRNIESELFSCRMKMQCHKIQSADTICYAAY